MVGSAAHRTLDRHGSPVEVWNYSKDSEDDYGENYSKVTPVESVPARVVPGGTVQSLRDAYGADLDADAEVFVEDSVSITRDGGGDGATRLDVDGDGDAEYVVLLALDQKNGLQKLVCRRTP